MTRSGNEQLKLSYPRLPRPRVIPMAIRRHDAPGPPHPAGRRPALRPRPPSARDRHDRLPHNILQPGIAHLRDNVSNRHALTFAIGVRLLIGLREQADELRRHVLATTTRRSLQTSTDVTLPAELRASRRRSRNRAAARRGPSWTAAGRRARRVRGRPCPAGSSAPALSETRLVTRTLEARFERVLEELEREGRKACRARKPPP